MNMVSRNPATEAVLGEYEAQDSSVDRRLDLAADTQKAWRRTPVTERLALLPRLAAIARCRIPSSPESKP